MILFIYSDGAVVHSVALDSYMPGGIQETKESLAREMNCRTEDIKVKITGIRNGKPKNGSSRLFLEALQHLSP